MSWARVAAVNESFQPMSGVTIEAYSLDTLKVLAIGKTDLGGVYFFNTLPSDQRWFFKPRDRRTSATVGGQVYTGVIHIQILNMSPGALGKDAVVDKTGHGTHTTIQAAITMCQALASIAKPNFVIHVNPGAYTELLTVTFLAAGLRRLIIEAQGGSVFKEENPEYAAIVTITQSAGGGASDIITLPAVGGDVGYLLLRGISLSTGGAGKVISDAATGRHRVSFDNCYLSGPIRVHDGYFINSILDYNAGQLFAPPSNHQAVIHLESCYVRGKPITSSGTNNIGSFVAHDCFILSGGTSTAPLIGISGNSADEDGVSLTKCRIKTGTVQDILIDYLPLSVQPTYHLRIVDCLFIGPGKAAGTNPAVRMRGLTGAIIIGNIFRDFPIAVQFRQDVLTQCNLAVLAKANSFTQVGVAYSVSGNGLDGTSEIGNSAYSGVTTEMDNVPDVANADVHNLLSATHPDTLAAAVLDGSIIIGNVTPKWSSLVISIPAADVRNVLAIDNAELRPSWKAALDATAPSTISESAAPAAGTSLIFSHRDHVHGAPATWAPTAHTHAHGDLTGVTADQHHNRLHAMDSSSDHSAGTPGDLIYAAVTTGAWTRLGVSTDGKVLTLVGGLPAWTALPAGVTDHGALTGLVPDDDHTQYLLLAGRAGGQTAYGGTVANDLLALASTSHATKAAIGITFESDANFGVGIVSSNTRLTFDANDYYEYNRAGNYHGWVVGSTQTLQLSDTYLRHVGYARVGSLSTPTNVTAGDLNALRMFIGADAAMAANAILDVQGGVYISGNVGIQAAIDPNIALSTLGTSTITAGVGIGSQVFLNAKPGAASSADYYGQYFYVYTAGAAAGAAFSGTLYACEGFIQHFSTGTVARMVGFDVGLTARSGSGLVAAVYGVNLTITSSSVTNGITVANGVRINAPVGTGSIGTITGVYVANMGRANITNAIGLDIAAMSGAATLNIALRVAGTTVFTPSANQTLVAASAILANATIVQITAAAPAVLTSTPTIADGQDGQVITIINDGANAITLQDQGTLANSNLRLTGVAVVLAARQSVKLTFNSTINDWVQTGPLVAVL